MGARLKHKKGRKSNYVKSLNNEYWREVKRRVLVRDRSCRNIINGKICESKLYLERHHVTYYTETGINIRGKELNYLKYVILVCSDCHDKIHNSRHKWNPKYFWKLN